MREELLECAMLPIPVSLVNVLGLKAYPMHKEIAHF